MGKLRVSRRLAYHLGQEARRGGIRIDENPFPPYSGGHNLWRLGWEEVDHKLP